VPGGFRFVGPLLHGSIGVARAGVPMRSIVPEKIHDPRDLPTGPLRDPAFDDTLAAPPGDAMSAHSGTVKAPALKGRILKAGSWTLGSTVVAMVLRLASNVVLAHLLFPDAFGLMSVVTMLITAMGLFSDIGISRSVIQSKNGADPDLLDTAWTLQVIRGFGLGAGCIGLALLDMLAIRLEVFKPGTVYADPRLAWLMIAFALTPMIQGFDSIKIIQAKRQMTLHATTKIELTGQLASAIAMVIVAYVFRTVWTLVVGAFVAAAVRTWLGHMILPGHRTRLRLVRASVTELLKTGRWVFLSSILFFLALNSDKFVLAALIDKRLYGIYSIALLMANVIQGLATKMCMSIVYPALAEVHRERPRDLARTLSKFLWAYDGIITVAGCALITGAPAVIHVLYDKRYADASWMLSLLAVGIVGLRYQVVEECYQAVGAPYLQTLANLLRLCTLVFGVTAGLHFWGVGGAIAAVALCQFSVWPLALWFRWRRGIFIWRSEALVVPAIAAGLLLGWLVTLLAQWALPQRFAG